MGMFGWGLGIDDVGKEREGYASGMGRRDQEVDLLKVEMLRT